MDSPNSIPQVIDHFIHNKINQRQIKIKSYQNFNDAFKYFDSCNDTLNISYKSTSNQNNGKNLDIYNNDIYQNYLNFDQNNKKLITNGQTNDTESPFNRNISTQCILTDSTVICEETNKSTLFNRDNAIAAPVPINLSEVNTFTPSRNIIDKNRIYYSMTPIAENNDTFSSHHPFYLTPEVSDISSLMERPSVDMRNYDLHSNNSGLLTPYQTETDILKMLESPIVLDDLQLRNSETNDSLTSFDSDETNSPEYQLNKNQIIKINLNPTSPCALLSSQNNCNNNIIKIEKKKTRKIKNKIKKKDTFKIVEIRRDNYSHVSKLMSNKLLMKILANKQKRGAYKCTHCTETFSSIFDFAQHMDDAKFTRPYKCPIELCPWHILGLKERSDLRRHCSIQHKYDEIPEEMREKLNIKNKEAPILNCESDYCDKVFHRKDALTRHNQMVHKNTQSRFNKRLQLIKNKCPYTESDMRYEYISSRMLPVAQKN